MHPVKQRLDELLAQAKGTRWDVLASKTCFTVCAALTTVAGLSPYTGFIPGRAGTIAAGVVGCAGAILPRATKAAGMLKTAQDQKTPFLKVLPQIALVLLTAPKITADAKSQAEAAVRAQQAQDRANIITETADLIEARLKTGAYTAGTGAGNLSQDVPIREVPSSLTAQPQTEAIGTGEQATGEQTP